MEVIGTILGIYASLPPLLQMFVLITFLVVAVVLLMSMRWLRTLVWRAALVPLAAFVALSALFSFLFGWLVRPITRAVLKVLPLDRMISWLFDLGAVFDRSALARGDRKLVAEAMWPQSRYPELYADVQSDIERPPFEDGRLVGGYRLSWLQDRHFTRKALQSAVRAGVVTGVMLLVGAVALQLLAGLLSILGTIPGLVSGKLAVVVEDGWPGLPPQSVGGLELWLGRTLDSLLNVGAQLVSLIASLPGMIVVGFGGTLLIAVALMRAHMRVAGALYEKATKDADVRWPYRAESRALLRQAYRRQIEFAATALAGARTYLIGRTTGVLRTRGDSAAPLPGGEIRMDDDSLCQHLIVFGGTGEGKTRGVIRPLTDQIMKTAPDVGMFVADAKGMLWRSVQAGAAAAGRSADVRLVGIGPSCAGIDIGAGLTPSQIAAVVRSVMGQLDRNETQAVWSDLSANVLRHMLTIGAAYGRLDGGIGDARKAPGDSRATPRPGSLWWAYQAVLNGQMVTHSIDLIRDNMSRAQDAIAAAVGPAEAAAASQSAGFSPELSESIAFVEGVWQTMPAATRNGVVTTLSELMDGFSNAPDLTRYFINGAPTTAAGEPALQARLQEAFNGKLLLVTLASAEDGLPARLVTMFLKTALYRIAREQMSADREVAFTARCVMVMDDVHELATTDPASGLSDATFWTIARSAGLAGVFATQSLAALEQTMGEQGAESFVESARSKIFLRTEERRTVDYACWCAGAFERNRVYQDGQRESIEQRLLLDGFDPLSPLDDDMEIDGSTRDLLRAAQALIIPDTVTAGARMRGEAGVLRDRQADASAEAASETGARIEDALGQGGDGDGQRVSLPGRFANDAVLRSAGNEIQPALRASDLLHMGRWHAFAHIQRAGAVRQDIIVIGGEG